MSARSVRRGCQRRLVGLDVPAPFEITAFCARLAERQARPIHLQPMAMPSDDLYGLWIATPAFDMIFYERYTSRLHQEHIILHEVGHLLSEHHTSAVSDAEACQLALPGLDPHLVQRMLSRSRYSAADEREAEMTASLILEKARRWDPASEWAAPPDGTGIRGRIGGALDSPADRRRS